MIEEKLVNENIKKELLLEYLRDRVRRAGFGGAEIQRTLIGTRIVLVVERPGLVIGRGGKLISSLTNDLKSEFGIENPIIEVVEEKNPNLNPMIVASKMANLIERGWHFRRLGHNFIRDIMRAGAPGCQIVFAGKLTGDRHRTEKFTSGHIKYCGDFAEKWVKTGYAIAYTKPGTIGVTVKIMEKGAVEPSEPIEITEETIKEEKEEVKVEAEAKEKEEKKTAKKGKKEKRPRKKKETEAKAKDKENQETEAKAKDKENQETEVKAKDKENQETEVKAKDKENQETEVKAK
ncbi:MAG: 30S ribosomal protein S3, partial [Candidatus Thermoplasmatota archaeon]|nr:30S ribosomal protein S3 [Candidatus Thermoplasmatota archaeon]